MILGVMIPDAFDSRTLLPRPLRVLVVTAELAPFARAGGLGDVMQGLSRALGNLGVELVVVTPYYEQTRVDAAVHPTTWKRPLLVSMGGEIWSIGVVDTLTDGDVRVLLLDCPPLFKRPGIYGTPHEPYHDNDLRFGLLSMAALRAVEQLWDVPPDVVHAHDWHAGLAPAFARLVMGERWQQVGSIFTFHNLAYQGDFPPDRASVLQIDTTAKPWDHAFANGRLNFLKTGICFADRITTVSKTYAKEALQNETDYGLEGVLSNRSDRFLGIINGIDTEQWGPSTDRALAARYDSHDPSGRAACTSALASELGLDTSSSAPIIGIVSRLTPQKGIDLLLPVMAPLAEQGMRFAVVAFGNHALEQQLTDLSQRYPRSIGFRCAFGDPIARRIYAGADMFLMPSRFEPCGLGQQYAMRYGAVPIVSAVGGLRDTVEPINEKTSSGTGFWLSDVTSEAIRSSIEKAAHLRVQKPQFWSKIVRNCLTRDGSWDVSARNYYALYRDVAGALPRPSLPVPRAVQEDKAPRSDDTSAQNASQYVRVQRHQGRNE